DTARERIAGFLRVGKEEVVFTSGGTESDNMAIKGVAAARGRGHLITSAVEHHAVLRTCEALAQQGFDFTGLPVDGYGMVSPDDVRRAIRPDTILVTIMHANSEVGTIQPVGEIGRITRERGVAFHVDGVQTFGKLPLDLDALNIDLLSFSGHKIYGPKGIAGLYIRKGTKMASVQHGGEHERRRRAGARAGRGRAGQGGGGAGARHGGGGDAGPRPPGPPLDGAVRAGAGSALEWASDRAAPRYLQCLLPSHRVRIDRARPGSQG